VYVPVAAVSARVRIPGISVSVSGSIAGDNDTVKSQQLSGSTSDNEWPREPEQPFRLSSPSPFPLYPRASAFDNARRVKTSTIARR
jgi:hypothetical protein